MSLLLKSLLTILVLVGTGCSNPTLDTSGRVVLENEHGSVDLVFTARDRALIREYYGVSRHLPPGLAKKERLPPGLRKQLMRRGQLPPGLQLRPLPRELTRRLSPIPEDYRRGWIGGSVVLLNEHSRVIFDVIHDL